MGRENSFSVLPTPLRPFPAIPPEREERRLLRSVVVAADVGEDARLDLAVDVSVVFGVLLAFDVLLLEGDDVPLRNGDQPEVERQRHRGDGQRPEEVGPHQPAERHAARVQIAVLSLLLYSHSFSMNPFP